MCLFRTSAACINVLEEKNKGQVLALEERINTAKEEARKESLERQFNFIKQTEYESE